MFGGTGGSADVGADVREEPPVKHWGLYCLELNEGRVGATTRALALDWKSRLSRSTDGRTRWRRIMGAACRHEHWLSPLFNARCGPRASRNGECRHATLGGEFETR